MFHTTNTNADNTPANKGIPTVATSRSAPRRSVPEYRQSNTSSDQRNFNTTAHIKTQLVFFVSNSAKKVSLDFKNI